MSSLFKIAIRIGLLCTMPLFLISNIGVGGGLGDTGLLEGSYSLLASGNLNQELKGAISFKTKIHTTAYGNPFSTLELKLNNDEDNARHSMGFLISEKNQAREISVGSYAVAGNIEGFLNNFDGVFGFANVDAMGELPFFAQKGRIVITDITDDILKGKMEITLHNSKGKLFKIKGDFRAVRNR